MVKVPVSDSGAGAGAGAGSAPGPGSAAGSDSGCASLSGPDCSIERTLGVVGERWTFLILREAFLGASRFAQFRERLGAAPDVLSNRLGTLVDYGVMQREPYQEPGARSRFAYVLTPSGRELLTVLAALQQWGDEHLPRPQGPYMLRRVRGTDCPVRVGYLDDDGHEVKPADLVMVPTNAVPAGSGGSVASVSESALESASASVSAQTHAPSAVAGQDVGDGA